MRVTGQYVKQRFTRIRPDALQDEKGSSNEHPLKETSLAH
jgi:hypothetical protein